MSSTRRLDKLLELEVQVRKLWDERKAYEVEAGEWSNKEDTYFITFPYPYMNGRLHLGHSFSLTKSEFTARFQRLNGKHVLWPFGFHCTGMPIAASADKIKNELADEASGNVQSAVVEQAERSNDQDDSFNAVKAAGEAQVFASRKSKAVSKTGGAKKQSDILLSIGVPAEEIPKFADAGHWLRYFPPIGEQDLRNFGTAIDWRRSFITTDANPYYDAFVRWQFTLLKERNRLKFGLRPAIFSRIENQPCADHDRASGEGVGPVSLNILKLKLTKPSKGIEKHLTNKGEAYVLCLTAPQSGQVIGKPHFYLNEDVELGVYPAFPEQMQAADICESDQDSFVARKWESEEDVMNKCVDVFVCHPRFAENMAFQGFLPSRKADSLPYCLGTVSGSELADCVLESPDACSASGSQLTAQFVTTGKIEKGPRITVASAPPEKDEAPDAAVRALEKLKSTGVCLTVYEPEKQVLSRSGDECIVALCNQWYSDFGNQEWKDMVLKHIQDPQSFDAYGARALYVRTVEWLDGWACSRNYGLGTYVPWELERGNKIVIESLSDSTVYWSYYTIAHFLQGDMFGSTPGLSGIKPEQLSRSVFDYVFCQTNEMPSAEKLRSELPEGVHEVPTEVLKQWRSAFEYWYPISLRCSGKDLIQNHLTMSLFHHAAIWPHRPDFWPRGYFVNGHIMLDSAKMSKMTGNFLTMAEAMERFSTDGTRVALADAGDSLDDANFEQATAVSALMKLYLFITQAEEFLEKRSSMRTGEKKEVDLMFEAKMEDLAAKAKESYAKLVMRDANKYAFYEQLSLRDWYRLVLGDDSSMHVDSFQRWLETVCLTLSPIAPHVAEYVWTHLLKKPELVVLQKWPQPIMSKAESNLLLMKFNLLNEFAEEVRKALEKNSKKRAASSSCKVIGNLAKHYSTDKAAVLEMLRRLDPDQLVSDTKLWQAEMKSDMKVQEAIAGNKKAMGVLMGFASFRIRKLAEQGCIALLSELPFDELEFFQRYESFLKRNVGCDITFKWCDEKAAPGAPSFELIFE